MLASSMRAGRSAVADGYGLAKRSIKTNIEAAVAGPGSR